MSTPQRGGYSSRSKGKNRGRTTTSSSRAPPPQKKQKVGTPGGAGKGVQFEAALDPGTPAAAGTAGLGGGGDDDATGASSGGEGVDTFSYDDVSNLATVTPVVIKRSVSRAEVESSGGSATDRDTQQQRPQQGGRGKKRAAERQGAAAEGTDT